MRKAEFRQLKSGGGGGEYFYVLGIVFVKLETK